jgi:hypothetical protein
VAEHVTTTPSGITIVFEDGLPGPDGKSRKRSYTVNGQKLPSVTTVLNCLDKPGLKFWGEKVGVAGAIALAREGKLPMNVPGALSAMQARDLRIFQTSDKAASRGTLAHEDLLASSRGRSPPISTPFRRTSAASCAASLPSCRSTVPKPSTPRRWSPRSSTASPVATTCARACAASRASGYSI